MEKNCSIMGIDCYSTTRVFLNDLAPRQWINGKVRVAVSRWTDARWSMATGDGCSVDIYQ